MDPILVTPSYGLGPQAPYLARPAPVHYGDFFGADQGFSTVFQSLGGYDVLNGAWADADVAAIATRVSQAGARLNAPAPAENWMQTAGAGILLLAVLGLYLNGKLG
jgi:hypothetical protein